MKNQNLEQLTKEIKNGGSAIVVVDSTNISTWAYNGETKTLSILFKKGYLYQYENVPKEVPLEMLNCKSVGKCFWNTIRNQYAYSKLNADGSIAYTSM